MPSLRTWYKLRPENTSALAFRDCCYHSLAMGRIWLVIRPTVLSKTKVVDILNIESCCLQCSCLYVHGVDLYRSFTQILKRSLYLEVYNISLHKKGDTKKHAPIRK